MKTDKGRMRNALFVSVGQGVPGYAAEKGTIKVPPASRHFTWLRPFPEFWADDKLPSDK